MAVRLPDIDLILRSYDAQGVHRTGQLADDESARWLLEAAEALGVQAWLEPFAMERIEPAICFLEIDGTRIPGTPMFDAPATGPDGISGILGTEIGLAARGPRSIYQPDYDAYRAGADRSAPGSMTALVTVTQGGGPGLALFNAERFPLVHGLPNLMVSSTAGPILESAVGKRVRLVTDIRRVPSEPYNVVALVPGAAVPGAAVPGAAVPGEAVPGERVPGEAVTGERVPRRDAAVAPVVVMTPRSGWWHCASERGGGIACWLAVLHALRAHPPASTVTLVASSGHELGHVGLDDFMARRPGLTGTATWVHFGANIGARASRLAVQSAQDDLRALASSCLAELGQAAELAPPTQVPTGESRDIHKAGGRYLTFVGSNELFHLPQDRYPDALDMPAITRIATAAQRIVLAMTR